MLCDRSTLSHQSSFTPTRPQLHRDAPASSTPETWIKVPLGGLWNLQFSKPHLQHEIHWIFHIGEYANLLDLHRMTIARITQCFLSTTDCFFLIFTNCLWKFAVKLQAGKCYKTVWMFPHHHQSTVQMIGQIQILLNLEIHLLFNHVFGNGDIRNNLNLFNTAIPITFIWNTLNTNDQLLTLQRWQCEVGNHDSHSKSGWDRCLELS